MADIFISYTSTDSDWAKWIAKELESLGHTPHVHEWEIAGGGDIAAWMEERHHNADHILCVVSEAYLKAPYSSWERRAAQWTATTTRPNFALPVFIEACEAPTLLASVKRCDLHGLNEGEARARFAGFMKPAVKPTGPFPFPGTANPLFVVSTAPVAFPGGSRALSNIPMAVPRYFIGRREDLANIDATLKHNKGPVAITALHGLRGVGKTTLAAAYAEQHRGDYRVTWWIRAQTELTMRADLVGLGIRLGWVGADDKEEPAVAAVMERLRHEGKGILLIFDNAIDVGALKPYLPRGGATRVLVTSNSHAWRGVAAPVEIRLWPKEIGADYLISRTDRTTEQAAAESLSEVLGGLPLAHEQAAAYCEDLGISLAEYQRRFEAAAVKFMDDRAYSPTEYHPEYAADHSDHLTVAGTFRLAIEEAAKLHPAAEPLIVHGALLAPEPIPLFLFSEAREKFGEPLKSAFAGDGLDKAVAALRTFALVDREIIADKRDPSITTDCIRLHRLVRQVAAERSVGEERDEVRRGLLAALVAVCPRDSYNNTASWPLCAVLTPHVLASCDTEVTDASMEQAALLASVGNYFLGSAAYAAARLPMERALAIYEKIIGPDHPDTATSLVALANLLRVQGDLSEAQPLLMRALAIDERRLGPEHPETATDLNNIGRLLHDQGDLAGARPFYERALAIREKVRGPEHTETARSLNNLATVLHELDDLAGARPLYERALTIREKILGPTHPDTAMCLNNLAGLLRDQGYLPEARSFFERSLAIFGKAFGTEHPNTNLVRGNLASLLLKTGEQAQALVLGEAALAADEKIFGPVHPSTKDSARVTANALDALGRGDEAKALRERHEIGGRGNA